MEILPSIHCWCGNTRLDPFAPGYRKCPVCTTLISENFPETGFLNIADDRKDFYGKEYWFSHQEKDLGLTDITVRARTDLSERCLYWLRTLLKYRIPPARFLELGSAHGGFVAMLRWAGFEATGLELSPWVVEYAKQTFHVPMLHGQVENQKIEDACLDGIFLMDVLEHLADPLATIHSCFRLLKPDGFLMIQTPRFSEGKTFEAMKAEGNPFLRLLQPTEHLFLFSEESISKFFGQLEASYLFFEPAIFDQYDMFFLVSRKPRVTNSEAQIEKTLSESPSGRFIQALLDLNRKSQNLQENLQECEKDRADRLILIQELSRRLQESVPAKLWRKVCALGNRFLRPK